VSSPRVADAPIPTSQSASAAPFGNEVSMVAVVGSGKSSPTPV
jgi:hypothetical protein